MTLRVYSIWADYGGSICFDDPACPSGIAGLDYTDNFLDDQPGAVPAGQENPRVCLASDVTTLLASIRAAAEAERAAWCDFWYKPGDGKRGPKRLAWETARANLDALLADGNA